MNYNVRNIYKKTDGKKINISVPGSKSVTVRAMLIAAAAKGESVLYGANLCDDTIAFLNCLNNLGIKTSVNGDTVKIEGCDGVLPVKSAEIDVKSAGTAARFLTAFLAFQRGKFKISCSDQMQKRPIAPLICALESLGAKFEFLESENCFPFIIEGTTALAERVSVDVTQSSQFLSALLLAAPCARKGLTVKSEGKHDKGYVNMTLDIMWSFGLTVEEIGDEYIVKGNYSAKKYDIEPDVSSACYFYAANKILGTDIRVNGIIPHTMQGDYKFIELLKTFDGGKVDMSACADQTLTLAAIAPYFSKPTHICGVEHIRKQESDRISAIVYNLNAMGVKCEEREDGVIIYPSAPKPAVINTFGDQRVAMSFALTGLRADGIIIENAGVCSKTYPQYFETWDSIIESLT